PFIDTPAGWTKVHESASQPLAGGLVATRTYVFIRIASGAGSAVAMNTTDSVPSLWGYTRATYRNPHGSVYAGPCVLEYRPSTASMLHPSLATEMTNALRIDWISQGVAQQAVAPPGMTVRYNDNLGSDGLLLADEQIEAIGETGT